MAGQGGEPLGRFFCDPGGDLDPGLVSTWQLELGSCPAGLYDLPRVAGGRCRMNDDGGCSALGSGTFVLVVPSPVVQALVAFEKLVVPIRIVVQHDQDLAGQVATLEVVPFIFGSLNPIPDKDQLGFVDL